MPLSIAIVGAGPAGCMLARLLHNSPKSTPLAITVFEAEASPDYRSQGGSLDLHESSGLTAMRNAGLYSEFLKYARFDGAALKLLDKQGKKYLNISASTNGNPEIDRAMLRKVLYESLPEGMVKWGKKLVSVDVERGLEFADGTREGGFDLMVGADGAWSKTRRYLDDQITPRYSGVTRYWSTIPEAKTKAPAVYELVNRGSVFSYSDGKAIMGQQMGSGNIDIAMYRVEHLEMSVKTVVLQDFHLYFEDWTLALQNFLTSGQQSWTRQPLYELPVGYSWGHKTGVTLMGDSAHLMTPFAGEGVNLAFVDSMRLAHAILNANDAGTLDKNVRDYELDMNKRATRAQAMTLGMKEDMLFTEGAPRTSIESWILRKMSFELTGFFAPLLYPLLAAGTYIVFFFVKLFI